MAIRREWFVYILRTRDGRLYTGVSTDVDQRFKQHCKGPAKGGARFFSFSPPEKIIYRERCADRSEALRREAALKRLGRREKLAVIGGEGEGR